MMDLFTMTTIIISIFGITFITNKSMEKDYKMEAKATRYFHLSLCRNKNSNEPLK